MEDKMLQLQTLSEFGANLTKKVTSYHDDDAVESLIKNLANKLDVAPHEVVIMRKEAMSLNKVADFLEKFADDKAKKNSKEVSHKELEKVKAVLLEALGIRGEMVDLLLKTAQPDELRAVAANIRKEANKRSTEAETLARIDREAKIQKIAQLQAMQAHLETGHMDIVLLNKFDALRREIERDQADLPIKELCQEMEGKAHAS